MSSLITRSPSFRAAAMSYTQLRCYKRFSKSLLGSSHDYNMRFFKSTAQPKEQVGQVNTPNLDEAATIPLEIVLPPSRPRRVRFPSLQQPRIERTKGVPVKDDVTTTDNRPNQANKTVTPAYFRGSKFNRVPYWKKVARWKDVTEKEFLSYNWGIANDIQGKHKLIKFLSETLPEDIPHDERLSHIKTRDDFVQDVMEGIAMAPMSIRIPPHILASIDWNNPLSDPLRRQFIPMKSTFEPNHPKLTLDSLNEKDDSPCDGLVHRYPDKCLFLATSHCPLYCRYCTRSYAVGAPTETVTKAPLKAVRGRWDQMLNYIANTPAIQDVVISGGDSYSLDPRQLRFIGDRLLDIEHVRRFRVATKGLCVHPSRTLDPDDFWTDELIRLAKLGKERGKQVAMHTHFNHPNEFSWVSREAAHKLHVNGVVVRNQSVLLKGVNDDVETMKALIRELADNNIQPYYVYACDLVKGIEDLRTPLQTILDLECEIRGSIAGFMTPQFVVDLPGGGGKRLASSYQSYDRETGVSTFVAPAVTGKGKENRVYEYFDPLHSLPQKKKQPGVAEDAPQSPTV